jgi:hypothetical protein
VKIEPDSGPPFRGYLLGELSPEDHQQLEQRLLIETEVFEELQRVEDDLIEDFISGALSVQEENEFETLFLLTLERRQKLNFAKALRVYVGTQVLSPPRL